MPFSSHRLAVYIQRYWNIVSPGTEHNVQLLCCWLTFSPHFFYTSGQPPISPCIPPQAPQFPRELCISPDEKNFVLFPSLSSFPAHFMITIIILKTKKRKIQNASSSSSSSWTRDFEWMSNIVTRKGTTPVVTFSLSFSLVKDNRQPGKTLVFPVTTISYHNLYTPPRKLMQGSGQEKLCFTMYINILTYALPNVQKVYKLPPLLEWEGIYGSSKVLGISPHNIYNSRLKHTMTSNPCISVYFDGI